MREKVTLGTSALFLMTKDGLEDKVIAAIKSLSPFEIISTTLSPEQEEKLHAAFAEDPAAEGL